MKVGELRRICDELMETHGKDLELDFLYPVPHATQRRTKIANITSYEVIGVQDGSPFLNVRFHVNYARGKIEEAER